MHKAIFILTAFLLTTTSLYSQAEQQLMDSLEAVIENPKDDTTELSALFELFELLEKQAPQQAAAIIRRQVRQSRALGLNYWEAIGLRRLAVVQFRAGAFDSTMASVARSIDLLETSEDSRAPKALIASFVNQGVFYQTAGDLEKAISSYETARQLSLESGHKDYLGKILNNLGAAFKRIDRFDAAYRTYQEALALKRANGDSLAIANTLYNLATLEMKNKGATPALLQFEEARTIYLALGDSAQAATVDIGIGSAYYQIDSMELALKMWKEALETPGISPTRNEAVSMYAGLGDLSNKAEDYKQAIEYLTNAESLANESTDAWMRNDIKGALARAYAATGQIEASNTSYRAYQVGVDTLTEMKRLELAQEMSEKYETALRDAEIERQGLLIERQRGRQLLLGLGALLLALLAAGIFLLYRSRLRYQRSEAEAQLLKQQQRITEVEQQAELNSLRGMIEGQEAERHRVAKDLHDGLGGMLSSIKTRIGLGNEPLENAAQLLDVACKEVRRIAHNMVPQSLALSGLSGALEDICTQIQLEGLECELEIVGQPALRLNEKEQSMLLRIVQELTHNVQKHAAAKRVFIQLVDKPDQILLTVEDDGKGFDPETARAVGGLGLSSIDNRVNFLKGAILYDSSPGHGTTISITIPL